jgi:uncharacterized lipoprotein YmbA
MTIEQKLKRIVAEFAPTEEEPELTMFGLISRYNAQYDNHELIGGDWVLENTDIRLPL